MCRIISFKFTADRIWGKWEIVRTFQKFSDLSSVGPAEGACLGLK